MKLTPFEAVVLVLAGFTCSADDVRTRRGAAAKEHRA